MDAETSNKNAQIRWNRRAVGGQRSKAEPGNIEYFKDIEKYRYGYETPFIPDLLLKDVNQKKVLEIGVGNGIDATNLVKNGAIYSGIDITENHLLLTKRNFENQGLAYSELHHADLLSAKLNQKYDVIYSFGVLHHISHEIEYLDRIRALLAQKGELRVSLYSKYSFFNMYMFFTWILKNKCSVEFNLWQGFVSDAADFDHPITIKIRSKQEILDAYTGAGFRPISYHKRGFVQNYIPFFGRFFSPSGFFLNLMGSVLGWYHVFVFVPDEK